ncbi:sugar phosphate isomerase/epimerase [Myxococcota bacterium]|nr:sugar phosphate isomerase/epimerase [Myxococcota bacterium]
MPRYGYATLNHSTFHGLPTQWESHLDAAATAGFDALAPDIFWLRSLEAEGVPLERIADGLRDRGLACMEISGLAIGDDARTKSELEENLRYARALSAKLMNTRLVVPVDDGVVRRLVECADALRTRGAREGGTRIALEFSSGSGLRGVAESRALIEASGRSGVGVTIDTWHFFNHAKGPDWGALEALPDAFLANLQLSDGVPHAEGDFWDATMNHRRLPGEGGFDLARLARHLEKRDFAEGAIVLEVLSAAQRERSLVDYARDSLQRARRIFG